MIFVKKNIIRPLEKLKAKDSQSAWEIVGMYEFIIDNLLMKDGELTSIMQDSKLLPNLEEMINTIESDKEWINNWKTLKR